MRTLVINLALLISALVSATSVLAQSTPQPLANAHAHNDYRHERPFWDAYENGFCSFEVDIYRVDDKLLVAHDFIELQKKQQTIQELYLEPMKQVISKNGGRLYPDGPRDSHAIGGHQTGWS